MKKIILVFNSGKELHAYADKLNANEIDFTCDVGKMEIHIAGQMDVAISVGINNGAVNFETVINTLN